MGNKSTASMINHYNLASLPMLATIRYWWWWASHDLAYLERIEGTKGLDFDLVQSIAKDYGIARGIRKEKSDPDGSRNRQRAHIIADAVNRRRDGFTSERSLTDRFELCLEIVDELNRRSDAAEAITHNDFVSGISKLSWFVAPKSWTMFDRLAAEAIGVKSGSARDKATRFYQHLDDTGFVKLASDMRSALPDSDRFYPERIVDQYLWLSASQEENRPLVITKTAAFLDAIGDEKRTQLLRMAEIIETNFATDLAKLIPDTHKTSKKNK
ncbi:hypothetical protein [Shinella zoogloeoides]|uniref:hypothetical protein n=1 Tax=Shinella zoogloeoides TaxID=352475 RepID=UPI00299D47DE|nr:hypothetical protein [Shinella zoogloeoides]